MLLHKSVQHDSRVRREAKALAAAGHEVLVLELAPVPVAERRLDGFHRRSVEPRPWVRRLPYHLYRALCLLAFVRSVARVRPDVVHAHDAAMLLPGLAGARLTGARLVYDTHELATGVPYRERFWAWFVGAVERLGVGRADAVITVSDGIAERLVTRYGLSERPVVVRNVCDLERRGEGGLRAALGVGARTPVVLHQGAPAEDRGCEVLIDAIAQVPEAHLAFLGDGDQGFVATLRQRAVSRGVADRVSFLPSVPLGELLAWTAEADVGVSLLQDTCENHRLALPNKVFEYLAAGVPVVVSDLPEVRRVVLEHGVGRVAAAANPRAVADGLAAVLGQRDDAELDARVAGAAQSLRWPVEQQRLGALYAGVDGARRDG
jgi:glycosyltransferase involved in cell wall biosynthesis